MDDKILEKLRKARQFISDKKGEINRKDERFEDVFQNADKLEREAEIKEKDEEVRLVLLRKKKSQPNTCTKANQRECHM